MPVQLTMAYRWVTNVWILSFFFGKIKNKIRTLKFGENKNFQLLLVGIESRRSPAYESVLGKEVGGCFVVYRNRNQ
jgi:hypothetical protein